MMHDLINLTGYHSVLCLNGDLPELSFFTNINLPLIAADGAANRLLDLGIIPQLIIGDLDSVRPDILKTHSSLHLPTQESSDYQKAMHYLNDNDLLPAIVIGINGGYLDHILHNINIFMETNCLLYAPPIKGFIIKEKSQMNFVLPIQTKISIIGIPEATLSTCGLKWDLNRSHLSFPGKTSCFNRTEMPEITLQAHQGSALILIYEHMITDAGNGSGPLY